MRAFTPLSWHVINTQILSDVEEVPNLTHNKSFNNKFGNKTNSRDRSAQGRTSDWPCHAFNRLSGCNNQQCRYSHKCSFCGGRSHPTIKCFKWGSNNQQTSIVTTGSSAPSKKLNSFLRSIDKTVFTNHSQKIGHVPSTFLDCPHGFKGMIFTKQIVCYMA